MTVNPWIFGALVVAAIAFFVAWLTKPTHKARADDLQDKLDVMGAQCGAAEQIETDAKASIKKLKAIIEDRNTSIETMAKSHEKDVAGTTAKMDELSAIIRAQGERIDGLVTENKSLAANLEKAESFKKSMAENVDVDSKAFGFMKGSDARMRAIKKVVPKGNYNAMAKYVNDAIKAGQFAKWGNPPKPITLKK